MGRPTPEGNHSELVRVTLIDTEEITIWLTFEREEGDQAMVTYVNAKNHYSGDEIQAELEDNITADDFGRMQREVTAAYKHISGDYPKSPDRQSEPTLFDN